MDDIRAWINGSRNYESGVALLLKHSADNSLKDLFTREPHSPFKEKKLFESLLEIFRAGKQASSPTLLPAKITQPAVPTDEKLIVPVGKWPAKDQFDETLALLFKQWNSYYSEMLHLQSRIQDIAIEGRKNDEFRIKAFNMAQRILELDDLCDEIYSKRDYYLRNKTLPPEETPVPVPDDHLLWPLKLANHKRYAREYRAKLKASPGNKQYKELLEKHELAVATYLKLLKQN